MSDGVVYKDGYFRRGEEIRDLREQLEWARALLTPIAGPWERVIGTISTRKCEAQGHWNVCPPRGAMVAQSPDGRWGWVVLKFDAETEQWMSDRVIAASEDEAMVAADTWLRAAGWFLREEYPT